MIVRMQHDPDLGWFPWALFLVFLHLKLSGEVRWSWWWVSAPLWGLIVGAAVRGFVRGLRESNSL